MYYLCEELADVEAPVAPPRSAKGSLSAVSTLRSGATRKLRHVVNLPEATKLPRRYGVQPRTPVNSREFTVNLLNLQ